MQVTKVTFGCVDMGVLWCRGTGMKEGGQGLTEAERTGGGLVEEFAEQVGIVHACG